MKHEINYTEQMSSFSPDISEHDPDFGPTLRGLRAGMKVFRERYCLVRMLGRGGMGVVWLAHDSRLDREVALKFLPESVQGDSVAVDELKRETKRCLELTHPNIVRIFDFEQEENAAAIAMEYVEGRNLSELRLEKPNRVFESDEVLPWIQSSIQALHHAHTQCKVVHRDLKPSNLMLDRNGELKVADFGIASRIGDSFSRLSRRPAESVAGTLVYMSPQQLMGLPPSVADDIYSLGATIYELLTGRPPFHSGSLERQIESIVPPTMAQRRSEFEVTNTRPIPEEWETMVAACLDKDANRRPQMARDIVGLLGYYFSGEMGTPLQPGLKGMSRRTLATVVLTVVLLVGFMGTLYNHRVVIPRQLELQQQAELNQAGQVLAEAKAEQLKREKELVERQVEQKRLEAEESRVKQATLQKELAEQNLKQSTIQADYETLQQRMREMQAVPAPVLVPSSLGEANPVYQTPPSESHGPWVFPDSSRRLLTSDELRGLSADQLWKARNEIYARRGYVFQTDRGRFFTRSLGEYYRGTTSSMDTVENSFNSIETANIEKIKSYE
jgi:serine/threonine protein kinase